MKTFFLRACGATLLAACTFSSAGAGGILTIPDRWMQATEPFRIVGNIYYVGTKGLAAYLIADGKQAILLDGTMPQNAPLIEKNIARLGFQLSDVKIILNSHAHLDHAGAIARLKQDTGAVFYASAADRPALEKGRHDGDTIYAQAVFPPVAVDRVVKDGEVVALGDLRLTATLTPGHTKGCTTWSMRVVDGQRPLQVVFPCSLSSGGNVLVGNKRYPGIVEDYQRSLATVATMKADVVLTSHEEAADIMSRGARQQAGDKDAFVDPALLQRIVAKSKTGLAADLAKQKKRAKQPG